MKPARPKIKTELPEPQTEPAAQSEKRWCWMLGLVLGVLLFAGVALVARDRQLHGLELSLFHAINGWPEALYYPFLLATIVPESLWIAVAGVMVSFLVKLYHLTWQLAAATVGGYALTYVAKHSIARARPAELVSDTHVRVQDVGFGFPSGHTMIITVLVLVVWPYLPRGWRWLVALLIPLMALSRVYLGVHVPLDVLGGFAIGLVVVCSMRVLPVKLREWLRFE